MCCHFSSTGNQADYQAVNVPPNVVNALFEALEYDLGRDAGVGAALTAALTVLTKSLDLRQGGRYKGLLRLLAHADLSVRSMVCINQHTVHRKTQCNAMSWNQENAMQCLGIRKMQCNALVSPQVQPLVEALGPLTASDVVNDGDVPRVILPLLREWLPLLCTAPDGQHVGQPPMFVQGAADWTPRPQTEHLPAAVWAAHATLLPLLTDAAVMPYVLDAVPGLPDAIARQLHPRSPVLWHVLGCWTALWAAGHRPVCRHLSQSLPALLDTMLHVCRSCHQPRVWHRGIQAAWAMLHDCHGAKRVASSSYCVYVSFVIGLYVKCIGMLHMDA